MATMTKHAPGTFSWVELGTTNQDAAKKFYAAVFGWTFKDTPMGPDAGVYTIFQNKDQPCAALYTLMPDMQKQGIPPHWGAYVTVNSADETAKKATTLGGKVMMEPFDVMGTLGRMAVIQDPTGAVFSVWQAIDHQGVGVLDEPGALTWAELLTNDTAKAEKFYTQLIGWKSEKMPMGNSDYTLFQRSDGANAGGLFQITAEMQGVPPNWTIYFQTADIQATVNKIKSQGGEIVVPPGPIPNVGHFAIVKDGQGAAFGLLQPENR
jgi:predicted enzyme related to lactoylglutathione lyase